MSSTTIISSCWFAWSCAAVFAVIALCSIFRSPLGLDALISRLDAQLIYENAKLIKIQERMIETQQKLIETRQKQLRLEGIIPWDDE